MTNYVALNNTEHGDLKVIRRYFREVGDGEAVVMTFPTEFVEVQREYPILLSRNSETGGYRAAALLGIEKGENLFLSDDSSAWVGSYVPAIVARGPFIVGFQERDGESEGEPEPLIYVDLDDPKVSETEGEPLFLEYGGNSPYLNYISDVLRTIHKGEEVGEAMFQAFDELGLIEPVTIDMDLKEGEKYQLNGYYTVSEERLAGLSSDSLGVLNRSGYLQGAFLIIASLSNIRKLIDMKKARQ